jgi:hypothetical protein
MIQSKRKKMKCKKTLIRIVLPALLSAILLTACSPAALTTPVIQSADLTENELKLLTAVGVERHFMFDVDIDQIPYDQMEYFVDYYEKGVFVEHLVHGAMGGFITDGKHRLNWSQSRMGNTTREEVWTVSFAGSRLTKNVELPVGFSAMSWSQAEKVDMIVPGDPVMLAAVVGSESGFIRSPGIIFDEVDGGVQALAEYDAAYIFTVVFHDEQ